MSRRRAAFLGATLGLAALPALAFEVGIVRPRAGEVLLGEVEVVARVSGDLEPAEVELLVDGRSAGRLDRGPFRWIVDLGERAVAHRLEVVARAASGETSHAMLETPGVTIDREIEVELVPLYVTVTRDGESVDSLRADDFTVVDEGRAERIVTFERGDVPLTAALVLDASESMRGSQLASAVIGARAFIAGMQPLDQAMLLLFADRVTRASPFTGFPEVLEAALEGVTAQGGTAINDHLYLALKLLEERRGRRVVILLSDGLDGSSVLSMRDVLDAARRSSALVYWLRLPLETKGRKFSSAWRGNAEHREEMRLLEQAVRRSGGGIVALDRVDQALAAFKGILTELRGQYVLGYYPTVDRDDGGWHSVKIKLRDRGLDVRYRDGYVDH